MAYKYSPIYKISYRALEYVFEKAEKLLFGENKYFGREEENAVIVPISISQLINHSPKYSPYITNLSKSVVITLSIRNMTGDISIEKIKCSDVSGFNMISAENLRKMFNKSNEALESVNITSTSYLYYLIKKDKFNQGHVHARLYLTANSNIQWQYLTADSSGNASWSTNTSYTASGNETLTVSSLVNSMLYNKYEYDGYHVIRLKITPASGTTCKAYYAYATLQMNINSTKGIINVPRISGSSNSIVENILYDFSYIPFIIKTDFFGANLTAKDITRYVLFKLFGGPRTQVSVVKNPSSSIQEYAYIISDESDTCLASGGGESENDMITVSCDNGSPDKLTVLTTVATAQDYIGIRGFLTGSSADTEKVSYTYTDMNIDYVIYDSNDDVDVVSVLDTVVYFTKSE